MITKTNEPIRVLSIDAWRESEGGWTWNNWCPLSQPLPPELLPAGHSISKQERDAVLKWFFAAGLVTAVDNLDVENDGYNYVVFNTETEEPRYAIEYGCHEEQ